MRTYTTSEKAPQSQTNPEEYSLGWRMAVKAYRLLLWIKKIVLHPVFVFVVLQIVGVTITVLWVVWFLSQKTPGIEFRYDVTFLVLGCVLGGVVIIGTVLLFIFLMQQLRLIKRQRSFVSSVTHEFRSPLSSMMLAVETLQRRSLSEDNQKIQYRMIQSDLDRLVHLVDQILVSARIDRGIKVFSDFDELRWSDFFVRLTEQYRHLDFDLGNRLKVSGALDDTVFTSERALQIVVGNIVENAIKYSPKESPIEVNIARKGKIFEIQIRDYGMGLDRRDLKRIFKVFERAKTAIAEAIPGTGLGLYIVQSIVQLMNGHVIAQSAGRGSGSSFVVRIPVYWHLPKEGE